MVISRPPGIILHIIIVLHQRAASIALNASRHAYISAIAQLPTTSSAHRNGAIKHGTHESDPRRDHQQIVQHSFCSCAALHLAVKEYC